MSFRVYVSGSRSQIWRNTVRLLAGEFASWQPVDPLLWEDAYKANGGVPFDEQVVNTSRHLLSQADAILVDARQSSWRAAMEVLWAHEVNKPVIVWGKKREDLSIFLRYHSTIVEENLTDAILRVGELSLE